MAIKVWKASSVLHNHRWSWSSDFAFVTLALQCLGLGFYPNKGLLTGFNHFQTLLWIVTHRYFPSTTTLFCFKQTACDDSKCVKIIRENLLDATDKADTLNFPWGEGWKTQLSYSLTVKWRDGDPGPLERWKGKVFDLLQNCCIQERGRGDMRRWEAMGEVGEWGCSVGSVGQVEIRRSKTRAVLKIFLKWCKTRTAQ